MSDVLEIPGFLAPPAREELLAEVRAAAGAAANLLGRDGTAAADLRVRRTTRVEVSPATRARVHRWLEGARERLAAHFGVPLGEAEEPQFLRYQAGDFFVPHQDGNTPMVWDDSRHRRVSVVLFLAPRSAGAAEGAYGGGSLVFHGAPGAPVAEAAAEPGSLVAFRAETTHEVTPVTHGERYTVVTWFRAPA